jgi:hypothetical protein
VAGGFDGDVIDAFTGATTAATILSVPGLPIVFLAVLGSVAAVVPVPGALVGAGMMPGVERAHTNLVKEAHNAHFIM